MGKIKGITVVSPLWGEREKTDRMVFSVLHQFISKKNPFKIHLVLVDDYIEGRGEGNTSPYDFYVSNEFKQFYDADRIKITLVKNAEHKYQGESREIGFLKGEYKFFLMIDCDDMLSPNACDRYLDIVNKADDPNRVACVYGYTYGFDTNDYTQLIPGHSIWVQGRCYNRDFIKKYGIHFGKGLHSRQGEDYPFIRKLDYAINHINDWVVAKMPYQENQDLQCTAFWFPNEDSLSRQDPHYGQHLAGWTMASSVSIFEFFEKFNKKYDFDNEEDENMKQELLNMNIYAFYNLLDFLKEVASTDYEPLEEDWYALRDNVDKLRIKLLDLYWDEIIYSNVEDILYNVHHHSDVRFTESWIGTFFDYMKYRTPILGMDYNKMREYCKELKFDSAGHEIHSPQVIAWTKRHRGRK